MDVEKYRGRNLSRFRTYNKADFFARIRSETDILEAFNFAKKNNLKVFVLGNGSNVFFKNTSVKSFVLKNEFPKFIKQIDEDLFEVSSSTDMISLLDFAFNNSRDCCYYLASAPCQIGGAIAMNAGSGKAQAKYISDFIVSVRFFDGEKIVEKSKDDLFFDYRNSEFLSKKCFIISAKLRLPKIKIDGNPIRERLEWARENQDLSSPNCGSLCNKYNASILKFVRTITFLFPAGISKKKLNWAINKARNPIWLKMVFALIKSFHKLFNKSLKFEIRIID